MTSLCLLGATGSIGTQVLDLVRQHPDEYQVKAISFNQNITLAREIITEFKPDYVACGESVDLEELKHLYPMVNFGQGLDGLINVATYPCENPVVINALVGSIGCLPTAYALKAGRNCLLANKETLVIAGELIMELARNNGVKIIPIDSEHSAIAQILVGKNPAEVKRIILTASGGSLFNKTRKDLQFVTVKDALNHPNWQMGAKITVDSATMMNKGFEIVEAAHLFQLPLDKIDVVIHRESIIHSMVEFNDGSVLAQLANPDMRIPIAFALNYPSHRPFNSQLDLTKVGKLSFQAIDEERFPTLQLARYAFSKRGFYPACLNAINEVMVKLFLDGIVTIDQIDLEIASSLDELASCYQELEFNLENVMKVDQEVKNKINQKYKR